MEEQKSFYTVKAKGQEDIITKTFAEAFVNFVDIHIDQGEDEVQIFYSDMVGVNKKIVFNNEDGDISYSRQVEEHINFEVERANYLQHLFGFSTSESIAKLESVMDMLKQLMGSEDEE